MPEKQSSPEVVYMQELKELVLSFLHGQPVRVYLFGSRARGDAREASDVDIAIEALGPIDPSLISLLRFELEESSAPYLVDVVDLNNASIDLKQNVKREGIVWADYRELA